MGIVLMMIMIIDWNWNEMQCGTAEEGVF